jgi:hypothetical protein
MTWDDKIIVEPGYHDVGNLDFLPVKIGDLDGVPVIPQLNSTSGIR